jgi:hypothetical protein
MELRRAHQLFSQWNLFKVGVGTALCLLAFSAPTIAADFPVKASIPYEVPRFGFFIGLGGSYNSVRLDRDLFAVGISSAFVGPTLVGAGFAQGPANPFHDTLSTFAPELQAGYLGAIAASSWLWGVKFRYKYLETTSTERGLIVPQNGTFITAGVPPTTGPLAGNVLIDSAQTGIKHELALLALLGHSFANSNVYLGAGPALFSTTTSLYRAVGFANINGLPTDMTGAPVSFSSSKWVWGTAAQVGVTYLLAPTWFLDFNYTFAISKKFDTNFGAPFVSTAGGLTYVGNAYITTSQRVTTQAFAVSINKGL